MALRAWTTGARVVGRPRAPIALLIVIGAASCQSAAPPDRIELAAAIAPADALEQAAEALRRQGYEIPLLDPNGLTLATEWRYERGWISLTRYRVVVQIGGSPPIVSVSAPMQSRQADGFVADGEEKDARKRATAVVVARLAK